MKEVCTQKCLGIYSSQQKMYPRLNVTVKQSEARLVKKNEISYWKNKTEIKKRLSHLSIEETRGSI